MSSPEISSCNILRLLSPTTFPDLAKAIATDQNPQAWSWQIEGLSAPVVQQMEAGQCVLGDPSLCVSSRRICPIVEAFHNSPSMKNLVQQALASAGITEAADINSYPFQRGEPRSCFFAYRDNGPAIATGEVAIRGGGVTVSAIRSL